MYNAFLLALGIVVDDAIVVIENTHRIFVEGRGKITTAIAAKEAAGEVFVPVLAGTLTMHGVSNKVEVPATIRVVGKKISADSKFMVKLADYNIKVPSLVANQVSETIAITVGCQYEPYKR